MIATTATRGCGLLDDAIFGLVSRGKLGKRLQSLVQAERLMSR